MVTEVDVEPAVAARELELFLDLVGYLSTTSASFFLDQTYSDLSGNEADLREAPAGLVAKAAESPIASVGHLVQKFLKRLWRRIGWQRLAALHTAGQGQPLEQCAEL